MLSQFAWPIRLLIVTGMGTALCLSLLFGARLRLLQKVGTLPFCSPNWLTLDRAPIVAIGMVIYLTSNGNEAQFLVGFMVVDFGLTLDRIDGMVAAALIRRLRFLPQLFVPNPFNPTLTSDGRLWAWWLHEELSPDGHKRQIDRRVLVEDWIVQLTVAYTFVPMFRLDVEEKDGQKYLRLSLTRIGEWLDPLIDKLNFVPSFVFLAATNQVSTTAAVVMIVTDLFGTVLRKPFDNLPVTRHLQRFVRESKATWVGKTKVVVQFIVLLAIVPATAGWLTAREHVWSWRIATSLLTIANVAGILSVVSRLTLMNRLLQWPALRRLNRRLRKTFTHEFEGE